MAIEEHFSKEMVKITNEKEIFIGIDKLNYILQGLVQNQFF